MTSQERSRSALLRRAYAIPVLGRLIRIATGIFNLPTILNNLYVFQNQIRSELGGLQRSLGHIHDAQARLGVELDRTHTEISGARQFSLDAGGKADQRLSRLEDAVSRLTVDLGDTQAGVLERLSAHRAEWLEELARLEAAAQAMRARLDALSRMRAEIAADWADRAAALEDKRRSDIACSEAQFARASEQIAQIRIVTSRILEAMHLGREGEAPIPAVKPAPLRPGHAKAAHALSGDIIREAHALAADAPAKLEGPPVLLQEPAPQIDVRLDARLSYLEDRLADVAERRPTGRAGIEAQGAAFALQREDNLMVELGFRLLSANVKRIALIGASGMFPAACLFDLAPVVAAAPAPEGQRAKITRAPEAVAVLESLRRVAPVADTRAEAFIVGPVLEGLSKPERIAALRWLRRGVAAHTLGAIQVGRAYWGLSPPLSAPPGPGLREEEAMAISRAFAEESADAGFTVVTCLTATRWIEGESHSGGLIFLGALHG